MNLIEKSTLFIEITVEESATVSGGTTVVTSVAGTSGTTTVVATNTGSTSGNSTASTALTASTSPVPSLILPVLAVVSSGLIRV